MNTSVTQEVRLEQKLEELGNQLASGKPKFEDFKSVYYDLLKNIKEFQDLLQWAAEEQRGKDDHEKFKNLYREVAGWNAAELMDSIKRTCFAFKNNRDIKDAFDRQGYRILELVR